MQRRAFIAGLGSAAAFWPVLARPESLKRIGYLSPAVTRNPVDDAFENAMERLGWLNHQNVEIEYRFLGGRQENVAPLVTEILDLNVDVILVWGPALSLAAKRATARIPIVFLVAFDPVEVGLVSNLPRPGGNVTGVSSLTSVEIFAKRLQLVKEVLPSVARVVVLFSTEQNRSMGSRDALDQAARILQLEINWTEVDTSSDLKGAVHRARDDGAQALYVWPSGFTFSFSKDIADIAVEAGLPSICAYRENVLAGGLIGYGADLKELGLRGAAYVDKILRGASPGDLPVEQLSRYELLVNLKTARALGLELSPSLLARADEVIE